MKDYNGKFIVFEGGEGSGKSTQAWLLFKYLKNKGKKVILTKEPGSETKICQEIRMILLENNITNTILLKKIIDDFSKENPGLTKNIIDFFKSYLQTPPYLIKAGIIEALLFLLDRADHIQKIIKPALLKGEIVVCDRFDGSTIAYQGYGSKLKDESEWKIILVLNAQAKQNICPDINILLDVRVKTSIERLKKRGSPLTNFEKKGEKYFKEIRQGFLEQAKNDPEHWIIINGEKDEEKINKEVIKILKERKLIYK